ncbi:MAG: DMT family transporter [Halobacteriales archaeon]|nr:DMT family transporter [Halobacteriales archaeon]
MQAQRAGLALIVASAVSFGGVAVLTKLSLAAGMGVLSLQALRWGIAFLAIAPFALRSLPRGIARRAFALGFVGQGLTSGLYTASIGLLPAALASFLLYLNPVFVAALSAALLREALDRRGLLALGVAVVGLGLLALAPGVLLAPLGIALALAAAVCYACVIVAGRKLTAQAEPLRVAGMLMLGATCAFAIGALVTGPTLPRDTGTWGLVALLGVLCTGLSVGTFYLALPRIGAPRAALLSTLEPVSTLVVAFLVLGETFTAIQALGALLILGAVALLARS